MKLDKKQRSMMQTLTSSEVFGLVAHFCREKVEALQLQEAHKVISVIAILEEDSGRLGMPRFSDRGRNLRGALARMKLSSLIGLALHHAPSEDTAGRLSDLVFA